MKITITVFLVALGLTNAFANASPAQDTNVWKCNYTIYNNSDGTEASTRFFRQFVIRSGHKDIGFIDNHVSSLKSFYFEMKDDEVCGGPDSCDTYSHAVNISSGAHNDYSDGHPFFASDDENQGFRFGDGKIFGFVSCAAAKEHNYYVTSSGEVLIDPSSYFDQTGMQIYAKVVGVSGSCAGGDLKTVMTDISSGTISSGAPYTYPVNIAMSTDGKSVVWTEIYKKCTKFEYEEDDRGGGNVCVQEEEISRRDLTLAKCM